MKCGAKLRHRLVANCLNRPAVVLVDGADRTRLTVERQLRTPLMKDLTGHVSDVFGRKEGAEWCDRVGRAQSQAFFSLRRRIRILGVGTERVIRVSAEGQMTLLVTFLETFSMATIRDKPAIPSFAAP